MNDSNYTTPFDYNQITITEAAELAGCKRDVVYRAVKSGKLPAAYGPSGCERAWPFFILMKPVVLAWGCDRSAP